MYKIYKKKENKRKKIYLITTVIEFQHKIFSVTMFNFIFK